MGKPRLKSSTKSCLLCQSPVEENGSNSRNGMGLLEADLEVMFLVRNLLDISQDTCLELLERFGSPCNWLDTCQSCRDSVRGARRIHREISLLSHELEKRKRKAKQKIVGEGQEFTQTPEKESAVLIRNCILEKSSNNIIPVVNSITEPVKMETEELLWADVHDDQDQSQDDDLDLKFDEEMLDVEDDRVVTDESDEDWNSRPSPTSDNLRKTEGQIKLDGSPQSDQPPDENEELKCPHCVLTNFSDKYKLTAHLRMTHWIYQKATSLKRKCKKCKVVLKIDALKKHCLETHGMQQCSKCPAVLDNRSSLRQHLIRLHKVPLKRNCEFAKRIRSTAHPQKNTRPKRARVANSDVIHRCSHCNYCAYKNIVLKRHLQTFHPDKTSDENDSTTSQLACDKCPLSEPNRFYNSHNELNNHKVVTHNMLRCDQCCYVCTGLGYLENHQEAYHSESNANADPSLFKRGQPSHYNLKYMFTKCRICQETFERRMQLTQHMFDKHPEELHSCEKCDSKFDTLGSLYAHKTQEHGEPDNPYRCPDCDYTNHLFRFVHKHRLVVHTGVPRVICEICSASFATEHYLSLHKTQKHGGPFDRSKFTCSYCEKTFSTPAYRKVHIKTVHLGQWRYKCPRPGCGMGFRGQKQVNVHVMQVHDKIYPFPCTEPGCQMKYTLKWQLRSHVARVHGPKLFKCSHCDYAAGDSATIKRHEDFVHNKTGSHQCDNCGNVYTTRRCLMQHLRLTHKIRVGRGKKEVTLSPAVPRILKSESEQCFPIGEASNDS